MANKLLVVLLLCSLITIGTCNPLSNFVMKMLNIKDGEGVGNGGTDCVACTIVITLTEQLAQVKNQSVDQVIEKACNMFPAEVKVACDGLVMLYGGAVIKLLAQDFTADEVCQAIEFCPNKTCNLFPSKHGKEVPKLQFPPLKTLRWVWPWDKVADHLPAFDDDGDKYATGETLRGAHWRGKDCDDSRSDVYPGHFDSSYDATVDHNCNGIFGINPNTSKPYEQELCSGTQQYGYIILGDSAGAHFHAPPEWLTASDIATGGVFANLLNILEDELDWPTMSSGTGYMPMTWVGAPVGPLNSIYQNMVERNLCMHRDYQNICVNGARSGDMGEEIVETMARIPTDFPVIAVHALIGNDVCNGHYGTSHMATPQQFYQNVMKTLTYLETVLPKGSHVVFMGLVDGRILYDAMSTRIHPIGSTNQDVTYSAFYDYMNCLQISPCFGWMNSDEYWRNATTARAMELNQVYEQIVANTTFTNFDMVYLGSPFEDVIDYWVSTGGHAYDLIELVDGFHPNQLANSLLTQILWQSLQNNFTELVNPINPNNDLITKIFGDQGGY